MMNTLCSRGEIIKRYNEPVLSTFRIVTATSQELIPFCDDWGDVMDNIPVVREKVYILLMGILDLPCTC